MAPHPSNCLFHGSKLYSFGNKEVLGRALVTADLDSSNTTTLETFLLHFAEIKKMLHFAEEVKLLNVDEF